MLAMTICRWWILLLIAGSAIGGIKTANSNVEESATVTTTNNEWTFPLAQESVPSVQPLHAVLPDVNTSREISTATINEDAVSKKNATDKVATNSSLRQTDAKEVRTLFPEITGKTDLKNKYETAEPEGRALHGNDLAVDVGDGVTDTRNSLHGNITDLSDVSMDYDDKDIEGGEYIATKNIFDSNASTSKSASTIQDAGIQCNYGNKTYAAGMEIYKDCEERCVCGDDGNLTKCRPLICPAPFYRVGKELQDSLCQAKTVPGDPCCVALVCAEHSEPTLEESCFLNNKTVARGDTVEDGCSKVCTCESGGDLKCRPRCRSNSTSNPMMTSGANQTDKCVLVPDPRDACCTITLCDVTLGDHEIKPDFSLVKPNADLTKVEAFNSTAIKLTFSKNWNKEHNSIELSTDNLLWAAQNFNKDGIIANLKPSRTYYVRVTDKMNGGSSTSMRVDLPAELFVISTTVKDNQGNGTEMSHVQQNDQDKDRDALGGCNHRGKSYSPGAEWYDECIAFCTCSVVGDATKTECATIECPTDFGLDVLDPHCLDWEPVPADFVPVAPNCCSQEVRCKNNGSCSYQGEMYNNWSEIPSNVTGCDKRCYCDMGNVSCQPACPPVPALPPANLLCPPSHASLAHLPEDECCLHWVCGNPAMATLPAINGRNGTSTNPGPLSKDSINHLQSIDDKEMLGVSESSDPQQWAVTQELPGRYTSVPRRKYYESVDPDSNDNPDETDDRRQIHYPMDPGHPTTTTSSPPPPPPPYNGPYSLNFKPAQPAIEDVFRLTPQTHVETNYFRTPVVKPKSKKPIELSKPSKNTTSVEETRFVTPTITGERVNLSHFTMALNEIPSTTPTTLGNGGVRLATTSALNRYSHNIDPPRNGDNAVPHFKYNREFKSPPGPVQFEGPSRDSDSTKGQNNVAFSNHQNDNLTPAHVYVGNSKPSFDTRDRNLSEELYRLIHLQHPGLIQVDGEPPEAHEGLHAVVVQPDGGAKENEGTYYPDSVRYFDPHAINVEAGGYHIPSRRPEVSNGAHQHIQELLLHVGEKDPNNGPFQIYRGGQQHPYDSLPPTNHPLRGNQPQMLPNSGQLTRFDHSLIGLDHGLPPGFPIHRGQVVQPPSDQITVQSLEAISEHQVKLIFMVSPILVGLHGRVEVRYTNNKTNLNPATWKSKVFAPPNDLIATPQLEFELDDLEPSSEYKVMVTVKLRDLSNSPTSKIYNVITLAAPIKDEITLPPQIPVDVELAVIEANSTWANIVWRKFTEYELQFIDGVQLRYKETEGKIYAATPLIHRAVTSYVIENLKPGVTYEVGIYFIPFPGQHTELISENPINFTTNTEPDPYSFDIKVDIKGIKSTEVEVAWKGVPYPEDKFVNIYRAIYQSDTGKEDTSTFKIAKRDSPAKTIIGDLNPGTRYRLWIEVYLTNGRIKKSNVQDFVTKPGLSMSAGVLQQGKLATSVPLHEGDYYGPLVIVAIVASLAILSTLILLMMLLKRRTSSKANISPRKTTSAYDNPSYKTYEDAPTTMTNGNDHEMESTRIV